MKRMIFGVIALTVLIFFGARYFESNRADPSDGADIERAEDDVEEQATTSVGDQRVNTARPARERLTVLQRPISWVSYYGDESVSRLAKFSLVDIEGENYSAEDIVEMKSGGAIVLSYLNIGACESERPYFDRCKAYRLDPYEGFPGEYWMDVGDEGFRNLVLTNIAPDLARLGIDGFYLDNIDVAEAYEENENIRRGVISLVRELRNAFPDKIIVAQNGLLVIDDIVQYVDALAKEDVYSLYNFDTKNYEDQEPEETALVVEKLSGLNRRGLPIFTLDYHTDTAQAAAYRHRATADGFSPYVATIELDRIIDAD